MSTTARKCCMDIVNESTEHGFFFAGVSGYAIVCVFFATLVYPANTILSIA